MIAINGRFLTQELTGVQRFAYEVTCLLKKKYGDEVIIITPQCKISKTDTFQLETTQTGSFSGYIWEQLELPKFLKKNGSPLLINFCNMAPVYYNNKISTIHDITYEKYPDDYPFKMRFLYKKMIPYICRSSKHILTVSEFSKKEMVEQYKLKQENISVVYNAANPLFHYTYDENLSKKKYILAFASTGQNKNSEMIFKTFEVIRKSRQDIWLYVIGNCHRINEYKKYIYDDHIVFLGRISDEDLIRYYSNACVFFYPSLYEGFGIPVIEAQACRCPVVASNVTTFPEILRNSAVLVAPDNLNEMVNRIQIIIDDDKVRAEIIRKGTENCKRFTWEYSCLKIIQIVDNLLK